jgi:serine/threonine protein kinase
VYLARDAELDRDVAIKVTNTHGSHAELEARMRTEALILARLEHPGIVPIHEVGTLSDGRIFYVMKCVRGVTLLEYIEGTRDLNDLLRVFERICEPVAFAHAAGYVHRDLKPENVMVGSFGEVLVMDWGVAKVLGDPATRGGGRVAAAPAVDAGRTDPGTVMGTPGFMPPEQAFGLVETIDQRADVYALGAILFTLLMRETPPVAPAADISDRLGRGSGLPKRLRAICACAMAPDVRDRYWSVDALVADLARYRSGRPVDAYPETLLDRAARLAYNYRVPLLLIIAYLIMRVIVALSVG